MFIHKGPKNKQTKDAGRGFIVVFFFLPADKPPTPYSGKFRLSEFF